MGCVATTYFLLCTNIVRSFHSDFLYLKCFLVFNKVILYEAAIIFLNYLRKLIKYVSYGLQDRNEKV